MITIKLTPEELFEARFCIKRYSELYPNHPNEYMGNVRNKIRDKLTVAYKQFQDNFPKIEEEIADADPAPTVPDNRCHMCDHWVKVGGHGSTDYGVCKLDGASIFDDDYACSRFNKPPVKHCYECNHFAVGRCHLEIVPIQVNPNSEACDRFQP